MWLPNEVVAALEKESLFLAKTVLTFGSWLTILYAPVPADVVKR
jgi:hypothetical protein